MFWVNCLVYDSASVIFFWVSIIWCKGQIFPYGIWWWKLLLIVSEQKDFPFEISKTIFIFVYCEQKREPTVWTLFYRILTALPRIPLSIHNICYWLLNNAQANLMQIFRNKNVAWNLLFMKYIFQIFKGFSKCVSIGSNQTTGFTIVHICQFPRKKVKSAVCIVSKLFTA